MWRTASPPWVSLRLRSSAMARSKLSCAPAKSRLRIQSLLRFAASEPVPYFDTDFARVVFGFAQETRHSLHNATELKIGVPDVPVVRPCADRQSVLLKHEIDTVTSALVLRVGHVDVPQVGVAPFGYLHASQEHVGFECWGENPPIADTDARRESDRRIEIVRVPAVTDKYLPAALRIAAKVVV